MTAETQTQAQEGGADHVSNVTAPFDLDSMKAVVLPENVTELNVSEIVLDDEMQVRRYAPDAKKIVELAHDIVRQGQLYPILYRVVGTKNVVVDGANRVRAIEYINENKLATKRMKVKAMLVDLTDVEAFTAGAAANIRRFEMSPIDHARVIKVMTEQFGLTRSAAGKILGHSPTWVTEVSQMAEFRAHIQKAIHERKIGYTIARNLIGLDNDEQDEIVEEILKGGAKKGAGVTRDKVRAKKRAKAQAKGDGQSEAKISLTNRELRAMFESLAGVGKEAEKAQAKGEEYECKYSGKVQEVALALIKALDGKLGERALANKIDAAR